jgi:hypothetical protein
VIPIGGQDALAAESIKAEKGGSRLPFLSMHWEHELHEVNPKSEGRRPKENPKSEIRNKFD